MDDVVVAAMPKQAPRDAEPETQRRPDAPPTAGIQRQLRPHRDHRDALDRWRRFPWPLAKREIGHFDAARRQFLGELAIPAFGAADGPGKQAIVDEANPKRTTGAFSAVNVGRGFVVHPAALCAAGSRRST